MFCNFFINIREKFIFGEKIITKLEKIFVNDKKYYIINLLILLIFLLILAIR